MSVVASMADEAISPAKKFWLKSQKEVMLAKYTPFVVCLALGKLELDTFRHYIAQDVHFLKSFARTYEKAEEYTDDDNAKTAISKLWRPITEEMKLHNSVLQVSIDQSVVDLDIPSKLGGFASTTIKLLGLVGVMSKVTWQVMLLLIPLTIVCLWMQFLRMERIGVSGSVSSSH